jgi:S-DNA-T family DNA segregation ATPase FtsK/SpoIIIE
MKINLSLPTFLRLNYLAGIIAISFALYFLLAFVSYNPLDPSFNRATDHNVTNFAGEFGAFIADPLIQLFGLSRFLIIFFPLSWGIQKLLNKQISYWYLRFFIALICILAASIFLYHLNLSKNLYFLDGGVIGQIINNYLDDYLKSGFFLVTIGFFFLSSFIFASGIKFADWPKIFINSAWLIVCILRVTRLILSLLIYPFKYSYFKKNKLDEIDTVTEPVQLPSIKQQLKSSFRKNATKKPLPIIKKKIVASDDYTLPSVNLLNPVIEKSKKNVISEATLSEKAKMLEQVLEDFGVYGKIIAIHPGPVVTLYELEPSAGTKSARIIGLADDISRSMSAISARIAVIPGRNAIGIELPNENREIVYLKELLNSIEYNNDELKLPIILGKDIGGRSIVVDLSKMPHLLVAGTTGSGKSVAINTMVLSLIYSLTPAQCKFIMIDPKMLELSIYDGIPHLLTPVVTEPSKAVVALKWTVKEMENRYRLMAHLNVRNIAGFNKKIEEAKSQGEILERTVQTGFDPSTGKPIIEKIPLDMESLPFIVVIVDEMADLMLVAGKDIEGLIQRLAQMARAAGIHIIMATQRPSVDVITGVIKANFPTRISFQVTSRIDSRTILGEQGGAEQLLGMGDMLYMSSGSKIVRVHGPFVDDKEVEKIVGYLKTQGDPNYIDDVTYDEESSSSDNSGDNNEHDDLYNQAIEIITRDRKVSTSYIQRCLKIGYNRAATIVERMEKEGLISKANHVGKREILVPER